MKMLVDLAAFVLPLVFDTVNTMEEVAKTLVVLRIFQPKGLFHASPE
jgi:hypothetical protein